LNDENDWFFRDKVLQPGEGHGWSAHDHDVVTLVLSGRLDEGLAREVQRCSAFELHYKPRGLRHATSTGPTGARMLLVGLRDSALKGLEPLAERRPQVLPGGARAARALAGLLAIAAFAQRRTDTPHRAIRQLWSCLESGRSSAGAERPSWITEVRERIGAEEAQRRSLARLASEFGVHPVYLARAFRSYYGITIGSLRRRLRAERAVAQLRARRESLAELALDLGYSDQSHFTREFKRETGWTPARFQAAALSPRLLERSETCD
jgi:AraC family transcriptional regulator